MVLSSTLISLSSVRTLSHLLASRLHQTTYDHASSTWMPSATSLNRKTSRTCAPGLGSLTKSHAFGLAEHMIPFREALKPGSSFTWTEELNHLFNESKTVIISEIENGVRIFDKTYLLSHGLVKEWHRLLAFPKTLHLHLHKTFLLPHRLEDHPCWQPLHPCS